jgi:hypothetical protein
MALSWNRKPILAPKPRYKKNDTSAAGARIAELRLKEALRARAMDPIPVPREFIIPPEELGSRWKPPMFRAVCEGVDSIPSQPAVSGWKSKRQRIDAPSIRMGCLMGCLYPTVIPGQVELDFCGDARQDGSSYCAAHHALTHLK